MKIHELTVKASPSGKRVGRGIGSGKGKTAGRGTKGQNSRTGGGVRPGFEGGQNPLAKRLPKKRGFTPISRAVYVTINLDQLDKLNAATVSNHSLVESHLSPNLHAAVKVLGTGTVKAKKTVKLQAATESAKAAIAKAGGTFEFTPLPKRPKKPSKRNQQKA